MIKGIGKGIASGINEGIFRGVVKTVSGTRFGVAREEYLPMDPDALAYIQAIQQYGPIPRRFIKAINKFVTAGKASGWWDACDLIYPIIGGSSGAHSIEMKSGGTLYTVAWGTSIIHSPLGVTGLGTASQIFGNTGWNPVTNGVRWQAANASMGAYVVKVQSPPNRVYVCGVVNGSSVGTSLCINSDLGTFFSYINNAPTTSLNSVNNAGGFYTSRRVSLTLMDQYRNGASAGTFTVSATSPVSANMYLMCRGNLGVPENPSLATASFWYFGSASNIDQQALARDVEALQVALNRTTIA